jgi:hypothetical protein
MRNNDAPIDTPEAEARAAVVLAMFRARATELQMIISADGRISEHDAAILLKIHRDTLRRKRNEGSGPKGYTIGVGKSQISYRLTDLARYVEKNRQGTDQAGQDRV